MDMEHIVDGNVISAVKRNGSYIYYYYYYENNSDVVYYDGDNHYDVFLANVQNSTAILGIILSVSSILVNLLVITVCFRNQRLKSDIFYLQLVNLSIANIFIGGFVIPLTVYSILYPWNLGEILCKIWIISDVYLPFVSLLILILLNVDRLMLLTHTKTYNCLFQQCLKHILLTCPWIVAFVFVVPLWTHGSLPYQLRPGECIVMLQKSVALACSFITYIVPCVCLMFIVLAITLVKLGHSKLSISCRYRKHTLDTLEVSTEVVMEENSETNTTKQHSAKAVSMQSIVSVFLASLLFCSMWFPYQCTNLVISFCTSIHCMPSPGLSQAVTWTATATSCVVPTAWLVDKNKRKQCEILLCGEKKTMSCEVKEDAV